MREHVHRHRQSWRKRFSCEFHPWVRSTTKLPEVLHSLSIWFTGNIDQLADSRLVPQRLDYSAMQASSSRVDHGRNRASTCGAQLSHKARQHHLRLPRDELAVQYVIESCVVSSIFHCLFYELYTDNPVHSGRHCDTDGTCPTAHIQKSATNSCSSSVFLVVWDTQVSHCAIEYLRGRLVHLEKGISRDAKLEAQNL